MAEGARPVVLIVRDVWGRNPNTGHDRFNAVKLAATPLCDKLLATCPWTLIRTSGDAVGLPEATMGNSEVGHQNLGAGRIVDQESVRISKAIDSGQFIANSTLVDAVTRARDSRRCVHLMGIASEAGVHGLMSHLYACLKLCRRHGHDNVALHLFTDGRDTGPFSGLRFIEQIEGQCRRIGVGAIASIVGRFYAMDRDNRWERIRAAYDLLTDQGAARHATAAVAIQEYYDHPVNDSQRGDEFITPRAIGTEPQVAQTRIDDGDTVIFYNYRGDRPRQIVKAFTLPDDPWAKVPPSPQTGDRGFNRSRRPKTHFVTMTAYEQDLPVKVAFPKPPKMQNIAGGYLACVGRTQFRCAETEKFPHVTFFFNDYREDPFPDESRKVAQSPNVTTYDLRPEMSAFEVRDNALNRIEANDCEDFILVNFANADMVGHTGKLEAAIKAVETVDRCAGEIVAAVRARGGAAIVTADHGNAEQMFDPHTQAPHTAHTLYDVECIIAADGLNRTTPLRNGGRLADVFPTALALMGLDQPEAMTGRSLIEP